MAYHISNRHLNLEPVLANVAVQERLAALSCTDESEEVGKIGSSWVILARRQEHFSGLAADTEHWRVLQPRPDVGVWTDDFSNILRVFKWNY